MSKKKTSKSQLSNEVIVSGIIDVNGEAVQTDIIVETEQAAKKMSTEPVKRSLAALRENEKLSLYGRGNYDSKVAKADNLKQVWITEIDKASKTTLHVLVPLGMDRYEMPHIFARPMTADEKSQYGIDPKKKARIYLLLEPNGELIGSYLNVYNASDACKALVSQLIKKT